MWWLLLKTYIFALLSRTVSIKNFTLVHANVSCTVLLNDFWMLQRKRIFSLFFFYCLIFNHIPYDWMFCTSLSKIWYKIPLEIVNCSISCSKSGWQKWNFPVAFPRMKAWLEWFLDSQKGIKEGSWRWRGRKLEYLQNPFTGERTEYTRELNPKTLTSGRLLSPRTLSEALIIPKTKKFAVQTWKRGSRIGKTKETREYIEGNTLPE